jgi:hypothetical protein
MPIVGDLEIVDLRSVFRVVGSSRQHLALRVARAKEEALIEFASGAIVGARLGALRGREALLQLLSWKDGKFWLGAPTPGLRDEESVPWWRPLVEVFSPIVLSREEIDDARD